MDARAQRLLQEALALPTQERAELTESLLESLDNEGVEGVEAAWRTEADRRLTDARSGVSTSSGFDEVLDRLSARLHGDT
jgi:putative addiction module component (TIGR02574 family)